MIRPTVGDRLGAVAKVTPAGRNVPSVQGPLPVKPDISVSSGRRREPAEVGLGDAQLRQRGVRLCRGLFGRSRRSGLRRFRDDVAEQPPGGGDGHHVDGGHGAGGLPHQRHLAGVAAEIADVVVHPVQGRDHILQARIGITA